MKKILAGLGNPGDRYSDNRHNAGFMLTDHLAKVWGKEKEEFAFTKKIDAYTLFVEEWILIKPQLFMNRSGEVVQRSMDFYKVPQENVYVAHDDLDIVFGDFKIHWAKGPKVHNGILSVEARLASPDFWRIRIGVDQRTAEEKATIPGHHYVLSRFNPDSEKLITEVFDKIEHELTNG